MKLQEIIKIPNQIEHGFDISKFDKAVQFKKVKVESYPLLAYIEGNDYFFVIITKEQEKIAFFKAIKIEEKINSREAFIIKRTWVVPKFRNKGIATAFYKTLHNQGFTIISDLELSPESISIWKKFGSEMINRDTKEKRPSTPKDPWHFIYEGYRGFKGEHSPDNFVIEDYHIFIGTNCP